MENTNCFNFGGQDSMLEDTAGRNMTANPYDGNSTYKKGAICIQNNKLYEANQNIDVAEQFTESHWTETTLGDIVSKNKSDIGELTEKMVVEFGSFNPSNTSIIIIQGSPIIIKYDKICYVHMILFIKQYLNTGDIIGDISFKSNSDITNIPIYTEGTNQQSGIHAFSLYSTGQIKAFSSMPEGGYIFDIMYEVA